MKFSAVLALIPLAAALPQAPAVEPRTIEPRTACSDTRDTCVVKCRPTGLGYIYCVSSCNAAYLWCKADSDDE
ncbi:uncharacterized protein Triagg1_10756 [Trichoderma aggressivum f. europaeum]|uniref:SSCRP protein n=1 Tax=Trichoderma aggressivum f. europaeum TaxID=173218 RepID=A0AAE1I581_9HYPO|nr:hypothetical protein Triagg1_10756 [Trichoderma aggressivum f. europaeum]